MELTLFISHLSGNIAVIISSVFKTVILYILQAICFKKQGKFSPCYSILAISRSLTPQFYIVGIYKNLYLIISISIYLCFLLFFPLCFKHISHYLQENLFFFPDWFYLLAIIQSLSSKSQMCILKEQSIYMLLSKLSSICFSSFLRDKNNQTFSSA